ncbi:MAG: hypothetical protein Q9220_006322 [cf. Caloplaca sp. 1 TL-2023]
MRLFLLPISSRQSLIYCQRLNKQLTSKTTYVDKVTTRASDTWLKWEKAEKGWQKKVTAYGNKLFERIPHEEWGLKSIPPLNRRRQDDELKDKKEVEVTFPSSMLNEDAVKTALKDFGGDTRQGFHSKWMWWSIIGMPISAPVALLPVIPNLPFFYLVFRAWSHWRARSGSQHVEFLLNNHLIKLMPSPLLDSAYRISELDVALERLESELKSISDESKSGSSEVKIEDRTERMLATRSSGRLIAELVEVPELEEQVQRAAKQVAKALRAKKELQEEKQELDTANKAPTKESQ